MKYLTNSEKSAVIAEQTEAFLANPENKIKHFRQGDSGIDRNMPFIITNSQKQARGDNWKVAAKGQKSYGGDVAAYRNRELERIRSEGIATAKGSAPKSPQQKAKEKAGANWRHNESWRVKK